MRYNPTARRVYLAPALGLVLVTAISACSSSSSSSSSSAAIATTTTAPSTSAPASSPAASSSASSSGGSSSAVSEITTNWNTFFNSATPNSKRVQLLQNGSQFTSAISSFSSSPFAAAVTSKVDSVTLTSSTEAKVKYDLAALGTTVASGASGTSVLQSGTWKVGDDVFCGLLNEAVSAGVMNKSVVPSVCSAAS